MLIASTNRHIQEEGIDAWFDDFVNSTNTAFVMFEDCTFLICVFNTMKNIKEKLLDKLDKRITGNGFIHKWNAYLKVLEKKYEEMLRKELQEILEKRVDQSKKEYISILFYKGEDDESITR